MRNLLAKDVIQQQSYNDIIRYRKYFGAVATGTTSVIPAQDYFVFQKGQGQQDANMSTNAVVTLQQCDTSLFNTQGIIPNASRFTCYGIAIDIHLSSKGATLPFESDASISGGANINLMPANIQNPYPLVEWFRSQCSFELWRNSFELLEQGNVADYPSGLSIATAGSDGQVTVPAAAGFTPGAAYTVNGFTYSGNGTAFRPLTVAQVFEPNDQFYGKLIVNRPAALTGSGWVGYIDFLLIGEAEVDRKSSQVLNDEIFVQNYGGA